MKNNAPNNELKKSNRSRIFNLLYTKGSLSKRDLQLQLGLSLPTITQYLTELIDSDLIETKGQVRNTGGRSAMTYSVSDHTRLAVGLDITAHHITAVIINLHGEVIAQHRICYPFQRTDEYFQEIGAVVSQIISDNSINPSRILGVGIGIPALTDANYENVVYAKIIDIENTSTKDFGKYIDFPVRIFNDANAACNIELFSTDNVSASGFYIMLSNNVGGAVFINGNIFSGDDFRSGEVGHLIIHPGGLRCYCGQRGCVDPYCSSTVLDSMADGDLKTFFELLDSGNSTARSIWDAYIQHLALAVRNTRILFNCPIIIGGYVGAYIDKYIDELRNILFKYHSFDSNADYVTACKYKTDAIAAGAALFFVKEFLDGIM